MLKFRHIQLILVIVCVSYYFIFYKKSKSEIAVLPITKEATTTHKVEPVPNQDSPEALSASGTPVPEDDPTDETIILTSENMQENILKCFQGFKCRLSEDAWSLYEKLKEAKNTKVTDLYLSYLRSKLKDPELRDVYREDLRRMIEDFYPPQEREFQDAAYYSYLGESQKSLDLYMDLRQKSDNDATLRQAPNMNIANVLYDLNRPADALTYYRMALNDLESKKIRTLNQEEAMKFLESRINELNEKLGAPAESED